MAILTSVSAENYRCFAEYTTLELKPITLLYGRNNSGKSALLRLLPLVGDAVAVGAAAPIDLGRADGAGRGSSFRDLKWKGTPEAPLRLSFQFDGASLTRVDYAIDLVAETRRLAVKTLAAYRGERRVLEARRVPQANDGAEVYDIELDEEERAPTPRVIPFVGLVPAEAADVTHLSDVRTQMASLRDHVQWLHAVRTIRRRYPELGAAPARLESTGEDAPYVLRTAPALREAVSAWYREHYGKRIDVTDAPPTDFRVLLRPEGSQMDIDLVDNGEGMTQLLPVLVALEMARGDGGPRFLAIEEPESHLHADAQKALAARLCSVASASDRPRLVLETHSEALMLGVQLEIAKGTISPASVVVYWLEQEDDGRSWARQATFDDLGRPEGEWPEGVFAEIDRLAAELLDARQRRARR